MFLTTNNKVIVGLKSPSAMVFHRKQTVCASALHFLLPFVSSEWGYKTTISNTFLCISQNYHTLGAVDEPMHCCLRLWPCTTVPSGHLQHLRCDSFDRCTERYEIVVYCLNQHLEVVFLWTCLFFLFSLKILNSGIILKTYTHEMKLPLS